MSRKKHERKEGREEKISPFTYRRYLNQTYRVILNDEFVGCDADVKGVDFGPPGSLCLSFLDSTKIGQDLEINEEGERGRKKEKKTAQGQ